ncbi:hypothetical protein IMZ31_20790 (plasmid) [Pontibacillus sp. ALD_SL1]|uniref:penicillin-binding transpeptidase domain-containing protein n=1 Tax=Pontibacillus sp. ALD_SL1 TaxID=2777185 RepID=UPI001A95BBDB|nr:penicillin-binding transpeptidase domain-containing protein [Pontibacillus sp. ALD_SL1]QST02987.1 hypothetical protein IMZ31_20790 [Pontibacillus sp. ALD_SL1]
MNQSKKRMVVLFWIMLVLSLFVIGGRYAYIQIWKASDYQKEVVENRVREIEKRAERGKIVDRNGQELAMSLMAYNIDIYPNLITSKEHQERVAEVLALHLDLSYDEMLRKAQSDEKWMSIQKRVEPHVVDKIKEEDVGGIGFIKTPKRYYPNQTLASGVLGFVNHAYQPGAGLEVSMNNYLAGIPGYTIAETDPVGNIIPVGLETASNPINGQNVHLTLDSYLQYVLEKRMMQGMEDMSPVGIHGIIMDPKNGDILAMASVPGFNPNDYNSASPELWNRQPSSYAYEPGSTIKPIIMAMALDEGAISTEDQWDDPGYKNVKGSLLYDWNKMGWGVVGLEDIIVHSSNVGMINIIQQMDDETVIDRLEKAGFGEKTGIPLPGEPTGMFPREAPINAVQKATISFGQGIQMTPLQLLTAFSEVINGGRDIDPRLVSHVKDQFGNVLYQNDEPTLEERYSKETSDTIRSYLKTNMEIGSGVDAQIEGIEMGGKTGSAWVEENGAYKKGEIVGSFIGFAPYEDPQVAMLIVVDQPQGVEFGSLSAGPIYKDVMEETLRYLSVKNEEDVKVKAEIPNVIGKLSTEGEAVILKHYPSVTINGVSSQTVVVDQRYTYVNHHLIIDFETRPLNEEGNVYIPDLYGMKREDVEAFISDLPLEVMMKGNGRVVEQSVPSGLYKEGQNLLIWFD